MYEDGKLFGKRIFDRIGVDACEYFEHPVYISMSKSRGPDSKTKHTRAQSLLAAP